MLSAVLHKAAGLSPAPFLGRKTQKCPSVSANAQALIAELRAEVQGIQAADMAQQQLESKLQAQLDEAKQMQDALLAKLSANTASSREEAKQMHTALLQKLSATIALGTHAVICDSSLS
jgi:hypothetical protein